MMMGVDVEIIIKSSPITTLFLSYIFTSSSNYGIEIKETCIIIIRLAKSGSTNNFYSVHVVCNSRYILHHHHLL